MRHFAALVAALEARPAAEEQTAALAAYLGRASEADRIWALALLAGRGPRRLVGAAELAGWAAAAAGLPGWLVADCRAVVGDLAETAALIVPGPVGAGGPGLAAVMAALAGPAAPGPGGRRAAILAVAGALGPEERVLLCRIVTGGLRIRLPAGRLAAALAAVTGGDRAALAAALAGRWEPGRTPLAALLAGAGAAGPGPRPFWPARPLDGPPEALGPPGRWLAEWAQDGLSAQIVTGAGGPVLWSEEGALLPRRLAEPAAGAAAALARGTVIDGTLVGGRAAGAAGAPAVFLACDLVAEGGVGLAERPFAARRARLDALLAGLPAGGPLRPAPELAFADWAAAAAIRAGARAAGARGLILTRRDAPRGGAPGQADRWFWPSEPLRVAAVLVYAALGPDRPGTPAGELTFAVRDGAALVAVAKVAPVLAADERAALFAWARDNTLERFGPVRRVRPELVFELGCDGVRASPRHRAGLTLSAPRLLGWRREGAAAADVSTLGALRALLDAAAGGGAAAAPAG